MTIEGHMIDLAVGDYLKENRQSKPDPALRKVLDVCDQVLPRMFDALISKAIDQHVSEIRMEHLQHQAKMEAEYQDKLKRISASYELQMKSFVIDMEALRAEMKIEASKRRVLHRSLLLVCQNFERYKQEVRKLGLAVVPEDLKSA